MIEILEPSKTKETVIDWKGIGDSRKKLMKTRWKDYLMWMATCLLGATSFFIFWSNLKLCFQIHLSTFGSASSFDFVECSTYSLLSSSFEGGLISLVLLCSNSTILLSNCSTRSYTRQPGCLVHAIWYPYHKTPLILLILNMFYCFIYDL